MAIDHVATPRLRELLAGLTEGLLTGTEQEELTGLLNTDDAARAFYRNYMAMEALLWWEYTLPAEPPARETSPPVLGFLGTAVHNTTGHFSSAWPVAYLVATVVLGLGLLIGSLVPAFHPRQIAVKSVPLHSPLSPLPSIVGRITGMVDCQWSDPNTAVPGPVAVPLGRKYALSSGLMEITYDTGAKVILQGPVTYEVESAVGGYLSVGKLTAKLEKKPNSPRPSDGRGAGGEGVVQNLPLPSGRGAGGEGGESSLHPSSFILHPLFSVRTPTAIVTDLGTEFGVEVQRNGTCDVHVFQGVVETVAQQGGKPFGQPCKIVKGQTAHIPVRGDASERTTEIAVDAQPIDPMRFVRQMPERLANRISYTWQIGVPGTFAVAKDDLINAGQPTVSGNELTYGTAEWHSSIVKLNDGGIYGTGGTQPERPEQNTEDTFNPSDGAFVTVTLNTTLHPRGYDIQSIVALTGSAGRRGEEREWPIQDRSSQKFDLEYSLVGSPDSFIALHGDKNATVDRNAHGYPEMQVRITSGSSMPIASGVARLRFTFHNTPSPDPESMYREIDVLGTATGEKGGTRQTVELSK